jgi:hypothetical protein
MARMGRRILEVIKKVWLEQVTTKSDFARTEADAIAAAASEGFITTRVGEDTYARTWLPTAIGLEVLEEHTHK